MLFHVITAPFSDIEGFVQYGDAMSLTFSLEHILHIVSFEDCG